MKLEYILSESKMIAKALDYAQSAHAGQIRKFSGRAYIVHPFRVYKQVKKMGFTDETVLVSAILHDTVEDTNITYDDLKREFSKKVADTVRWLTNVGDKNTHIHKLMMKAPKEAVIVKTADRIDNLSDGGSVKFINKYKGSTDIIKDGLESRGFDDLLRHFMPVYNKIYN